MSRGSHYSPSLFPLICSFQHWVLHGNKVVAVVLALASSDVSSPVSKNKSTCLIA